MVRDLATEMPPFRINMVGRMDAFLMDAKTGEVIEERHTKNTIVDGGEIWVAELLTGEEYGDTVLTYGAGELGWGIQYCQVGTDGSATQETSFKVDTTSITGDWYKQMTGGDRNIISPGNEMVLTASFTGGEGNGDLRESGLFSNSGVPTSKTDTSSRMFNRVNFATISKDTTFTLTFEWHVTIGSVT